MKKTTTAFWVLLLTVLAPARVLWAGETENRAKLFSVLEESCHFYDSVKNYTAIFKKQEMAKGVLGQEEKIFLKFEKPFKIFMGWLNTEKKDLQVVYERGKHRGRLAIHKPGLGLGLLPVIFLDQSSPWVKEGSESYDIEDAGIGVFLEDLTKAVVKAQTAGQLKVDYLKPEIPGEEAPVEVTFEGSDKNSGYFARRVIVLFDPKTKLPVRMKLFDWEDRLTGVYVYENLKIDLSPEDEEFKQQINRQLYRVYRGE